MMPEVDWTPVKETAEKLKELLNQAAHTSPADVANATSAGVGNVVHGTLGGLDHLIQWLDKKV
jgi:hypothetical protein